MMENRKLLFLWIISLFLITFTCSLVYLIAQQSIRLGANDQPTQLAKDTWINLEQGKNAVNSIPVDKVDIAKSLDTFVMVFDSHKKLVASSGILSGSNPSYPKGVLSYIDTKKEDRVTWQTKAGLRFATVAIKTSNGYIVGARSLTETEKLENKIGQLVMFAWLAYFICSIIAFGIVATVLKKIR